MCFSFAPVSFIVSASRKTPAQPAPILTGSHSLFTRHHTFWPSMRAPRCRVAMFGWVGRGCPWGLALLPLSRVGGCVLGVPLFDLRLPFPASSEAGPLSSVAARAARAYSRVPGPRVPPLMAGWLLLLPFLSVPGTFTILGPPACPFPAELELVSRLGSLSW